MSRWLLTRIVAVLASASFSLVPFGPGIAGASSDDRTLLAGADTGANQLQFWNVSLRLVNPPDTNWDKTVWKSAFDRMAEYANRPDIISVLEVPWHRRGDVMGEIEADLGVTNAEEYKFVHTDAKSPDCKTGTGDEDGKLACGNTMIVFRVGRVHRVCDTSGCEPPLRWKKYEQSPDGKCSSRAPYDDLIAVRLYDELQKKHLVVVSLHLGADDPQECVAPNLEKMNNKVEYNYAQRPLTIVAGDFNKHPDPRYKDDSKASSWRREERKACWYKRFSQTHPDGGCSLTLTQEWSFPYYDAIWVTNSSGPDDICDQWTSQNGRLGGASGTAAANDCDNANENFKHKRIDYIWLRYETPDGVAIEEDKAYADAQIEVASADRGFFDPSPANQDSGDEIRYSDHRALHALIYWCSPSTNRPTPCS